MFLDNSIACSVCGEMFERDSSRCPNCRTMIRRINRRNSYLNSINQMKNNIFTQLNSNRNYKNDNISTEKEELETRKMNFELYNKKNNSLEPPLCGICLENIEYGQFIYLLSCKHLFHKYCSLKWFKIKSECPFCRKKFLLIYK